MWVPLLYLGCCLCKAHSQAKEKHSCKHKLFFFFWIVTHFSSSKTKQSLVSSGDKHDTHVKVLMTLSLSQATIYKKISNMWSCTYVHSPWWDPQQLPLCPWLWLCSGTGKKQQTPSGRCYQDSWADMFCQTYKIKTDKRLLTLGSWKEQLLRNACRA